MPSTGPSVSGNVPSEEFTVPDPKTNPADFEVVHNVAHVNTEALVEGEYTSDAAVLAPAFAKATTELSGPYPRFTLKGPDQASTGPTDISIGLGQTDQSDGTNIWLAAALSKSGLCYYFRDTAADNVADGYQASGFSMSHPCTAAEALTQANQRE